MPSQEGGTALLANFADELLADEADTGAGNDTYALN
jgi:hypothetical protein